MADAKLTDLTAASTPDNADLMYLVQSAASRKLTLTQLMNYLSGVDPRTCWWEHHELVWYTGVDGFTTYVSSAGSVAQAGSAGHPGVIEISTSTSTSTSNGFLRTTAPNTATAQIVAGGGELVFEALVEIPTLYAGANTGQVRIGFMDEISGAPNNGIHAQYDDTQATWRLYCRNAGTSTNVGGVTNVATGWHHIRIVVNSGATSVELFVDGVSQGTVTTNIPTAGMSYGCECQKSAGTTALILRTDFIRVGQVFASDRY